MPIKKYHVACLEYELRDFFWIVIFCFATITCFTFKLFKRIILGLCEEENGLPRRPAIQQCVEDASTPIQEAQKTEVHCERPSYKYSQWKEILSKNLICREANKEEHIRPSVHPGVGCTVVWRPPFHIRKKKENATMYQQNQRWEMLACQQRRTQSQQIRIKLKEFNSVNPWFVSRPDKRKTEEEVLRRKTAISRQKPWVVPKLERKRNEEAALRRKNAICAQIQDHQRLKMLAHQQRRLQGQQILAKLDEYDSLIDQLWQDPTMPGSGGNQTSHSTNAILDSSSQFAELLSMDANGRSRVGPSSAAQEKGKEEEAEQQATEAAVPVPAREKSMEHQGQAGSTSTKGDMMMEDTNALAQLISTLSSVEQRVMSTLSAMEARIASNQRGIRSLRRELHGLCAEALRLRHPSQEAASTHDGSSKPGSLQHAKTAGEPTEAAAKSSYPGQVKTCENQQVIKCSNRALRSQAKKDLLSNEMGPSR